jgi:uncharacterized damage-inducible protein DinB
MMIAEPLIGELAQEAGVTRRLLERVPEEKLSWKPHPKSMSLGQLAFHLAILPLGIADLLSETVRELPAVPQTEATSAAEVLSTLEKSVGFATAKLAEWGDDGLRAVFTMTNGGQTLFQLPRVAMFRSVMLNHWYHHRGQLTVYLRLLDVPLPSIYGPTADEKGFGPPM